ncbi:MAG: hypothetical protein AABZ39_14655 [Spirochaetota bacterium]
MILSIRRLLIMLLCAFSVFADISLAPRSIASLWISPNTKAVIEFTVSNSSGAAIPCEIIDYSGAVIARMDMTVVNDTARAELALPNGYYEIHVPSSAQSFGIVSLPSFSGTPDPFFGIDAGLSWLTQKRLSRDDAMAIIKRIGVVHVRERLGLGAIMPKPDVFTPESYEIVRSRYAEHSIKVLEMFHSLPTWMEGKGDRDLPGNVLFAADAMQKLGKRWENYDAMLEVWNEVDAASYSGNKPVDQYVSLLKAVQYRYKNAGLSARIGTCGFTPEALKADEKRSTTLNNYVSAADIAGSDRAFLNLAAENGILDAVDFISIHYHNQVNADMTTLGYIDIIQAYRSWAEKYGHPAMPIVNTETGVSFPIPKGTVRPEQSVDDVAAAGHVFKTVESMACGIKRYYAFYLQNYFEDVRCWGLLDANGSPFRTFACYAYAIQALANAEYAGELALDGVKWTRVFTRGREAIIVLYSPEPAVLKNVPFAVKRIAAIDGSDVPVTGTVSLGKITYLFADASAVGKYLNRSGQAYRLYQMSRGEKKTSKLSPIVLQRRLINGREIFSTPKNYEVPESELSDMFFEVRVYNLSDTAQSLRLKAYVKSPDEVIAEESVSVPASSYKDVPLHLNVKPHLTGTDPRILYVSAANASLPAASPLAVKIRRESSIDDLLKMYPKTEKLPISDESRWSSKQRYFNWNGGAGFDLRAGAEGVRFSVDFKKDGHKWIFPFFVMKDRSFSGIRGIVIRGRTSSSAVMMLNFLSDYGKTIGHKEPLYPSDNKWHSVYIDLEDVKNIDSVRLMEVGGLSQSVTNTFEISDMYFVMR